MINERLDSPNTCSKIRLVLRQILNQAIEDELIFRNVANTIKVPKIPKPQKRALTNKEKKAILDADLNPQDRFYINLIYYFGLRREEALGIMRSDFDFHKNVLRVDRTIVFDKNTPVIDPLMKSENAHRTIPIPSPTLNGLKEYVHSCDSLYCITKQDGNLVTHSSFVKMWSRITKAIDCCLLSDKEKKLGVIPDRITSHMFRHNYCTILYYSGISRKKAVQLMGHSSFRMVEEIYAHLDEEKENAADKISNAFSSNF